MRIYGRFRVHRLTAHGIGIIGNPSGSSEPRKRRRDVALHCKVENDDCPAFGAGTQRGAILRLMRPRRMSNLHPSRTKI